MITDWTSMFPPDSDEYWPELQEAINYWEKRTADDSGMFNQLVFSLMQAEHRTEAAEAALAAVPVEAIRRYYLHSWSAPAEDYDDATLESDENAFVDWLKAAPQQEVQP